MLKPFLKNRVRFDRNELSGAFGDIGTTLPLLIGVIMVSGMDGGRIFLMFGLMQIATGIIYGIPMAVQPLKAFAMLIIAQGFSAGVISGGSMAAALVVLVLTLTGTLGFLAQKIPLPVIRGIQLGLGIKLATTGLKNFVMTSGGAGYILAGICFAAGIILLGNRKYPPAVFLVMAGLVYAAIYGMEGMPLPAVLSAASGPFIRIPTMPEFAAGFVLLALPQLPLSFSNSMVATERVAADYFPEKKITIRKIGFTYSAMNVINSIFGGMPTCHGSGGLAGHYSFGARTGGSVVIIGSLMALTGIFAGNHVGYILHLFPKPLLGVILLFEAVALMSHIQDCTKERNSMMVMLITGMAAVSLPYGYLIGMAAGTMVFYFYEYRKKRRIKQLGEVM